MRKFVLIRNSKCPTVSSYTFNQEQVENSLSRGDTTQKNWLELVPISAQETTTVETVTVEKKKCVVL